MLTNILLNITIECFIQAYIFVLFNIVQMLYFLSNRVVKRFVFVNWHISKHNQWMLYTCTYSFVLFLFVLCQWTSHSTKFVITAFLLIVYCQESLRPCCGFSLALLFCVVGLKMTKQSSYGLRISEDSVLELLMGPLMGFSLSGR